MARSYWTCTGCGTQQSVVGRNRRDADGLARWREQSGHLCDACQEKARAAENAAASALNAEAGLPGLTGTEKQVAWAETLRATALKLFDRAMAIVTTGGEIPSDEPDRIRLVASVHEVRALINADEDAALILRALRAVWAKQVKASWWIDTRSGSYEWLAHALRDEILAEMTPATEPSSLESEAEEEALLIPVANRASPQIATISFVAPTVRVRLPVKDEAFRLVVKELGFAWSEPHWIRTMTKWSGEPADRMAETAHRLLAAGFMVRLHDDEARAKAVAGDFAPEQRRWVRLLTSGEHKGWLRITWGRDDDFYAAARRLLGARYVKPGMEVPPGSVEEVADFAESYGFSISPGAMRVLEAHRRQIAAGLVVKPQAGEPSVRIQDRDAPERLTPPTEVEVDHDLLDHD